MNFHVVTSWSSLIRDNQFPHIKLVTDNWDDYSNKTLFHLYLFLSPNDHHKIGDIKIMHKDNQTTREIIPNLFTELNENEFCSLGQDLDFYTKLKKLLPEQYQLVLDALNDVATNQGIADIFENTRGFKNSLLRWSESEKVYRQARLVLNNIPITDPYKFTYNCKIDSADTEHSVEFNFKENEILPHRIIAIIGKNGTGKTQYLSKLAVALSGQKRNEKGLGNFIPHRPPFTKVIAVSYSAFDKFVRPKNDRSFSYKYCGLKDEKGFLNQTKLTEIYSESVAKIESLNRQNQWHQVLSKIIQPGLLDIFYNELFENKNFDIFAQKGKGLLSSGQSILMYVITEIIANIKEESLILFDEPEMHLHPNAIANLIRMLHTLLEINNSYAILATHSPIIVQEIPSDYVYVFERFENTPIVRKLDIECFGENISTITQNVFDTIEVKGTYKDFLEKISQEKTFDEVLEIFNGRLSFNASTFLKGIYNKRAR
jgi:predicted ATPase